MQQVSTDETILGCELFGCFDHFANNDMLLTMLFDLTHCSAERAYLNVL